MKCYSVHIFATVLLSFNGIAQTSSDHKNSEAKLVSPRETSTTVMFYSNRAISEGKAPFITERFRIAYPEIEEMRIETIPQRVVITLPKNTTETTLKNILNYFKTENYETL